MLISLVSLNARCPCASQFGSCLHIQLPGSRVYLRCVKGEKKKTNELFFVTSGYCPEQNQGHFWPRTRIQIPVSKLPNQLQSSALILRASIKYMQVDNKVKTSVVRWNATLVISEKGKSSNMLIGPQFFICKYWNIA